MASAGGGKGNDGPPGSDVQRSPDGLGSTGPRAPSEEGEIPDDSSPSGNNHPRVPTPDTE
ncbi:unnamed protein product, partial [Sphacelaria rigidula]